jgi:uncharacterized membrane protein YgcG
MKRFLSGIGIFLMTLTLLGTPTQAEMPCDASVVDAARFFGSTASIERAIADLEGRGAVVRVRTAETLGSAPSLDAYVDQMQSGTCTSWQGVGGGPRDNLIVLYIIRDSRDLGLYYGATWNEELGKKWPTIQAQDMKPAFRSGDFERGVVAGLTSIGRAIDVTTNPPPPVDLGGLWSWLWGLLGAACVAVLGIFGIRTVASSRNTRAKSRAMQQEAMNAQGRVTNVYTTLSERLVMVGSLISTNDGSQDPKLVAKWQADLNALKVTFETLASELSGLRADPSEEGKSEVEYKAMAEGYASLGERYENLHTKLVSVETEISEAKRFVEELPALVSEATAKLATAKDEVAKLREAGFRVDDLDASLASCEKKGHAVKSAADEKKYDAARSLLTEVGALITECLDKAKALPGRKTSLQARLEKGQADLVLTEKVITKGATTFEVIEKRYAETSYKAVVGNGTEAEKRRDAASDYFLKVQSTLKKQEWDAADNLLTQAEKYLQDANGLIRSIDELALRLMEAEQGAKPEIDAAQADISAALQFLKQHDADTDDAHVVKVEEAQATLNKAKKELAREKPDYLFVVKSALEANSTADDILEAARSEKESAERARTKAAAILRDAKGEISTAAEYIADHQSDVGEQAKSVLSQARQLLVRATTAHQGGMLAETIRCGTDAVTKAEEAMKTASRDVDDEEDRRSRAARRRRENDSVIDFGTGRSTSSWGTRSTSSSGGFSSGSKRSSSSTGSVGGGSMSFGGSSKGFGGGSSKW